MPTNKDFNFSTWPCYSIFAIILIKMVISKGILQINIVQVQFSDLLPTTQHCCVNNNDANSYMPTNHPTLSSNATNASMIYFNNYYPTTTLQTPLPQSTEKLLKPIDSNNTTLQCGASHCNTYVRFCLTVYQNVESRLFEDDIKCEYLEIITPILGHNNISIYHHQQHHTKQLAFTDVQIEKSQGSSGSALNYQMLINQRWQKHIALFVEVLHRDYAHQDTANLKLKGNSTPISRHILLLRKLVRPREDALPPSSSWYTSIHTDSSNSHNIKVHYRFACDEHYYGDDCATLCRPRSGVHGHYDCSPSGQRICFPGWSGEYCTEAVCRSKCINGVCHRPNSCRCDQGWVGELCHLCIAYPGCIHGGCRKSNKGVTEPYTCDCETGWGGMFCNVDLNYCSRHSNPCENNGICINSADISGNYQYQCRCSPGYVGTHCEKVDPNCSYHGCSMHGSCKIIDNMNQKTCLCDKGYYGAQCQFNQTKCSDMPCIGKHSKCVDRMDNSIATPGLYINKFICICESGYGGNNCELNVDDCNPNKCLNGGKCVDLINNFKCICSVGFSGPLCQTNNNECHNLSCLNGGHCVDLINGIACQCQPGFHGDLCQYDFNECSNANSISPICLNGGRCNNTFGSFQCLCKPGFHGQRCEFHVKSNCLSNHCLFGGICQINHKNLTSLTQKTTPNFTCICPPFRTGKICEIQLYNSTENGNNLLSETTLDEFHKKLKLHEYVLVILCGCLAPTVLIFAIVFIRHTCRLRNRKHKKNTQISMSVVQNNFAEQTNLYSAKIINDKDTDKLYNNNDKEIGGKDSGILPGPNGQIVWNDFASVNIFYDEGSVKKLHVKTVPQSQQLGLAYNKESKLLSTSIVLPVTKQPVMINSHRDASYHGCKIKDPTNGHDLMCQLCRGNTVKHSSKTSLNSNPVKTNCISHYHSINQHNKAFSPGVQLHEKIYINAERDNQILADNVNKFWYINNPATSANETYQHDNRHSTTKLSYL